MAMKPSRLFDLKKLEVDRKKSRDTSMVAVLVLLVLNCFSGNVLYVEMAIIVLLAGMIVPVIFKPLAYLWFGLAKITGSVGSLVLLSLVYFVILFPVAILRKIAAKDTLHLKLWKKDDHSVFIVRKGDFTAADLEKPY